MSFAYDVKAELCKVPINRSCCAVAEGCGVLLYASAFTANEVRIVTENDEFAARLPKLFPKAFSLRFDELPDRTKDSGKLVFRITQEEKLETIWRAANSSFSVMMRTSLVVNALAYSSTPQPSATAQQLRFSETLQSSAFTS